MGITTEDLLHLGGVDVVRMYRPTLPLNTCDFNHHKMPSTCVLASCTCHVIGCVCAHCVCYWMLSRQRCACWRRTVGASAECCRSGNSNQTKAGYRVHKLETDTLLDIGTLTLSHSSEVGTTDLRASCSVAVLRSVVSPIVCPPAHC